MERNLLTPEDVREVVFDKAPLGKRGYNEQEVDDFLDRVEDTLAGADGLTADEVRMVVFQDAPRIKRGYHEEQVDRFLDQVATTLDHLSRAGSPTGAGPAPRRASRHPAGPEPVPVPVPHPSEQTTPMPFVQPPSMPGYPPAQPAEPSEAPFELLALPIPPAPPGARGYRPGDVEKLARLLAIAIEQPNGPTSTDLLNARLARTFFNGQGYHTDAVDAVIAAWVEELRNREG
ncbi:MAG TPA: DivIVA domain-containing protein [Actinophytocola sp.]|uniref:DivIVA domain-containing protein n=1 Tax=Actinophytocola sp. TaxID=1872138 RepID=UPI002DB73E15|nr:DivIVA domain-containing protein [Actinophytocola sp.]HEU5475774.1 DivIVA domain-containing protein [Actinophytocola sp.]